MTEETLSQQAKHIELESTHFSLQYSAQLLEQLFLFLQLL